MTEFNKPVSVKREGAPLVYSLHNASESESIAIRSVHQQCKSKSVVDAQVSVTTLRQRGLFLTSCTSSHSLSRIRFAQARVSLVHPPTNPTILLRPTPLIPRFMPDRSDDEKDNSLASANSLPVFLLGLLLGFLSHSLIMGCFESKEQAIPAPQPAVPAPVKPVAAPVAEQPVLSVPRAAVQVTDRDRAELKAKSLRDKLSTFVLQSDEQMRQDGLSALQAKRAGNLSTARVILHRRSLLRAKVTTAQARVETVLGMIAAMEDAKDNAKTFDAIEKGTAMINEVMEGMSAERVKEVLDGSKEAEDRVREVNQMLGADGEMDQSDFEEEMAALEAEQPEAVKAADTVVEVPATTPAAPVGAEPFAIENTRAIPQQRDVLAAPVEPGALPVAVTTEVAEVKPVAVANALAEPHVPVTTDAAPPAPAVVVDAVTKTSAPIGTAETALERAEKIPDVPTVVPDMPATQVAAEEDGASMTDEKRLESA